MSECLGANTRAASSRSREGWRILDFTAKLWKHPAGCSLLVPAPERCLPERRTRNNQRPGRREAAAAGKPYAQKQNGGPPQLTTTDCAASSKKSRLLVATRAVHTWHHRLRTLLQCDLPARETIQVPAEPKLRVS